MKILVIGGTQFVGRYFVEAALERDHEVTLFHRGQTNPGLFEEACEILGDRRCDLDKLDDHWDIAVDTCGYIPDDVEQSARYLRDRVEHYLFVSTISVYRDLSAPGTDETDYLKTLEDPDVQEVNASTYGPLKTECEARVTGVYDHRSLIVRPGIICGPHDPTDRFSYWVDRVADGGRVLAPGSPTATVQLIDVRDLARWLVDSIEARRLGIYNTTGPSRTFQSMLDACRDASGSHASLTWVPDSFLHRVEIDSMTKMPLWNRERQDRKAGLYAIDSSKAVDAGLQHRSLQESARDTLQWLRHHPLKEWKAGISRLRERDILEFWHQQREHESN